MPEFPNLDELEARLRDAAYVAVGLGVLGFQRARARRVELGRRFAAEGRSADERVQGLRHRVTADGARQLDSWLGATTAHVERVLAPIEPLLPGPARAVVARTREFGTALRHRLTPPSD